MVLWHILVIRFSEDFLYIFETWYMVFSIYSFSDGFGITTQRAYSFQQTVLTKRKTILKGINRITTEHKALIIFYNGIIQTKYKENAKSKAY